MPRGSSDIPILRLEVLQKFMESFMAPPNLILSSMFAATTSPSSTIRWESQRGGRGMTPFVAPGTPAPVTSPHGVAQHVAEVAYWKEKMPFDEEFLNNLRQPGTDAVYQSAEAKLARELAGLKNRSLRRKEWMFAQMICNNGFSYQVKGGYRASVNYGIPSDHRITLASTYNWNNGASKDILGDIRDAKIALSQDCGGSIDYAICNSQVLKLLAADTTIRDILGPESVRWQPEQPDRCQLEGHWFPARHSESGHLRRDVRSSGMADRRGHGWLDHLDQS
jgi:hypothetical protein